MPTTSPRFDRSNYALAHRMILKSQARLRDRTPELIIEEILSQVPVPV